MGLLGVVLQASQGVLAGASIVQLLCTPPYGELDLARHMAYAPVAIPLHRTLQAVAFAAFLSGADAAPSPPCARGARSPSCRAPRRLRPPPRPPAAHGCRASIGRARASRRRSASTSSTPATTRRRSPPANLTSMVLERVRTPSSASRRGSSTCWKTCAESPCGPSCATQAWILDAPHRAAARDACRPRRRRRRRPCAARRFARQQTY